ncbi:hypothetical protein [Oceanicaulis sp. UBA2681]|nr:hypothetical protein [Oceanicaulis sp. UBA2681]
MIHQWVRALLYGVSGALKRGSRRKPDVDEAQLQALHAKIGELAVANELL